MERNSISTGLLKKLIFRIKFFVKSPNPTIAMINFTPKFKEKTLKQKINYETVANYMTTKVITFHPEDDIREVIDVTHLECIN